MSTAPPPRRRGSWRSPWAWPPVGITAAAITGKWFGGIAAMTVLGVVAATSVLGLTGQVAPLVGRLGRIARLRNRASKPR